MVDRRQRRRTHAAGVAGRRWPVSVRPGRRADAPARGIGLRTADRCLGPEVQHFYGGEMAGRRILAAQALLGRPWRSVRATRDPCHAPLRFRVFHAPSGIPRNGSCDFGRSRPKSNGPGWRPESFLPQCACRAAARRRWNMGPRHPAEPRPRVRTPSPAPPAGLSAGHPACSTRPERAAYQEPDLQHPEQFPARYHGCGADLQCSSGPRRRPLRSRNRASPQPSWRSCRAPIVPGGDARGRAACRAARIPLGEGAGRSRARRGRDSGRTAPGRTVTLRRSARRGVMLSAGKVAKCSHCVRWFFVFPCC